MSEYYPDSFIMCKHTIEDETLIRMICGWSGGYVNGNSWRISSPIVEVDKEESCFHTEGGSKYYFTGREGISSSFLPIYKKAQNVLDNYEDISLAQAFIEISRMHDDR